MIALSSLPTDYFDALYRADQDPWRIGRGWYEERKRALVAVLLPEPRYALGLEPGGGNGDLSEVLRHRCDRLVTWDAAHAAVESSRDRFADDPTVEVHAGYLPDDWPATPPADLLVISEIGYYLSVVDLDRLLVRADATLNPGATVLAVHWQWPATDYPQTGAAVHERMRRHGGWSRMGGYRDPDVLIDVFVVGSGLAKSVAQRSGVVR